MNRRMGAKMQEDESGQQTETDEQARPGQENAENGIPWERRDELGKRRAFSMTRMLVLRRNGRLGEYAQQPLDYSAARRFRRRAVLVGSWPAFAAGIVLVVAGVVRLLDRGNNWPGAFNAWLPLVMGIAVPILYAGALAGLTGASAWFFSSSRLDNEQRLNAVSIAYYLSAPLSWMWGPGLLGMPVLIELGGIDMGVEEFWGRGILVTYLVGAGLLGYWFNVVVCGMRDVLGRRGKRLFAAGAGLMAVSTVILLMLSHVPAAGMLWFYIWATTT